jgi:hypothetical protein
MRPKALESGRLTGSREPDPSCTGSGPSGFDPERVAEIASLIENACVPHESGFLGTNTRSLRYYASVGIDYLEHDHARCRVLFENAAKAAIAALQSERTGA